MLLGDRGSDFKRLKESRWNGQGNQYSMDFTHYSKVNPSFLTSLQISQSSGLRNDDNSSFAFGCFSNQQEYLSPNFLDCPLQQM